jgi:cytochrome P450
VSATADLRSFRWRAWAEDPYPLYRVLRDEQPVYFDAPNDAYVITRYADVASILRDHRRFSSVPLAQFTGEKENLRPIRDQDPPLHSARRRAVAPLFTGGEMRRRAGYFAEVAADILTQVENQPEVDVSSEIAVPMAGRVTCDLLGVPIEQHARFKELTEERLSLMRVNYALAEAEDGTRTIEDVRADLWELIAPLADERRAHPETDAISLLVAARDQAENGAEISEPILIDMLLHLLAGGFETTQHLVELLVSHLADHPALWATLRADPTLVDAAIGEMLRWDAPFQVGRRRPTEDVVVEGVRIPKDGTALLVIGSANRDERVFPDPDEFRLSRDLTKPLAFGLGIHFCPGAPVSRFEVRALLNEMLKRYERIERRGPSELWPLPEPMRTPEQMRGMQSVPIRLLRQRKRLASAPAPHPTQ